MSKHNASYQDHMQDVMIAAQVQTRANAREWLRRAENADKEAALSLETLNDTWDRCDRRILLAQIGRLEALAYNLRNKAADELRGLPLELKAGEGNESEIKPKTTQRAA